MMKDCDARGLTKAIASLARAVGELRKDIERGERKSLARIENKLVDLQKLTRKLMANINEVLNAVTEQETVIESVVKMLEGLNKQLKDALAGDPEAQAKVQAVFDKVTAQKSKLETAILQNTPAAEG